MSCDIIASGGVSCAKDCFDLAKTGVAGVIIGKALYTDRLKPRKFYACKRIIPCLDICGGRSCQGCKILLI